MEAMGVGRDGGERWRMGVDLGGTKTETVLLAPGGAVLDRHRAPTPLAQGYEAVLANVARLVQRCVSLLPADRPFTVGVGIPGSVDDRTGLVRNANSVCLNGRPLKRDLERLLGRAIAVENDANCFTMAEAGRLVASRALPAGAVAFGVIMGAGAPPPAARLRTARPSRSVPPGSAPCRPDAGR